VSARSGPIIARTASIAASSAWVTVDSPITCFESPSAAPTATVDGTSVSTAKNAISAACPVVRCSRDDRQTSTTSRRGGSPPALRAMGTRMSVTARVWIIPPVAFRVHAGA
jgi:hypothetical protein